MQTHQLTPTRRIVQHDGDHYDIEVLYVINPEPGIVEEVWAVIECGISPIGETMNGWTPTTPQEERLKNLLDQIPQEYQARAVNDLMPEDGNLHDFERLLLSHVIMKVWETYDHPAVEAWQAERMNDPFRDERLDLKQEQLTGYFGKVKVTTSKDWDKRHLYANRKEQAGAADRRKAAGIGGDTDKI